MQQRVRTAAPEEPGTAVRFVCGRNGDRRLHDVEDDSAARARVVTRPPAGNTSFCQIRPISHGDLL